MIISVYVYKLKLYTVFASSERLMVLKKGYLKKRSTVKPNLLVFLFVEFRYL